MVAGLLWGRLWSLDFGDGSTERCASPPTSNERSRRKQAFERQKKEYEIAWGQELTKYAWDTAKVEAERFLDRQKEAQYNQRMGWMTESAIKNLELNSEALYDKYVVEEGPACEAGSRLASTTRCWALANRQNTGMGELQNQSQLRWLMQRSRQIETTQQVAGYINAVQQRALQSSILVQDTENKATELQTQLVLDQASDTIQRDIQMIAAIEESNRQKAVHVGPSGRQQDSCEGITEQAARTGPQLCLLLAINRQKRGAQTAAFNSEMGP